MRESMIGRGLVRWCTANAVTAADLASRCGVPTETISSIMLGECDPPVSQAAAVWIVCRAVDPTIELSELFFDLRVT